MDDRKVIIGCIATVIAGLGLGTVYLLLFGGPEPEPQRPSEIRASAAPAAAPGAGAAPAPGGTGAEQVAGSGAPAAAAGDSPEHEMFAAVDVADEARLVAALDNKANIQATRDGRSVLHVAVSDATEETVQKRLGVVRLLVQRAADLNAQDKGNGETPVHTAARQKGDAKGVLLRALIDGGADLKATDNQGRTPLHHAATREHVMMLINKAADVNAVDANGQTPLHTFAAAGDKTIVGLLLSRDADASLKDKEGLTALEWAKKSGNAEVAAYIEEFLK